MKRSFARSQRSWPRRRALSCRRSASAAVIELGATPRRSWRPSCPPGVAPANCTIVLTRVTALETIRDGVAYPTTVKKAGTIVAFTVGSRASRRNRATARADIHFLDTTYGGTTQGGDHGAAADGREEAAPWTVVAESPVFHLQPYLGQVVQFPLPTPLPVTPGDVGRR